MPTVMIGLSMFDSLRPSQMTLLCFRLKCINTQYISNDLFNRQSNSDHIINSYSDVCCEL